MKNVLTVCLAAVLMLAASGMAQEAEEKPWFDMEKCGFCKHLLEDPEMLDHCTWEHHNIGNGIKKSHIVHPCPAPILDKFESLPDLILPNTEAASYLQV